MAAKFKSKFEEYYQGHIVRLWGWQEPIEPACQMKFTKAAICCAAADGLDSKERRCAISLGCSVYHYTDAEIAELEKYEGKDDPAEILNSIDVKQGRSLQKCALYVAIVSSSADGKYGDEEQAAVAKLGKALGLSEADVKAVEDIVKEEHAFLAKRQKVIYG